MTTGVLNRFVALMATALLLAMVLYAFFGGLLSEAPGDYYTRQGDNRLTEGKYDEALASFDRALEEAPNHRGALMGRAIVFLQTDRLDEAMAELNYLIDYLKRNLTDDDPTGVGALAAAYANRGRIHDLRGEYELALKDYVAALNTDAEAVTPGLVHKLLYSTGRDSSVRKRAQYIYEQLQLPADKRVMRIPELDAKQRMYKP